MLRLIMRIPSCGVMPSYCILQLDISGWVHIVCGNILNSKEWQTFKLDAGFLQTL